MRVAFEGTMYTKTREWENYPVCVRQGMQTSKRSTTIVGHVPRKISVRCFVGGRGLFTELFQQDIVSQLISFKVVWKYLACCSSMESKSF